MISTKRALPRRTFLRGIGAAISLPLLDAMVPAFTATVKTAATPARRLAFVYCPNGVSMNFSGINYWKPTTVGSGFELSPILEPLAPFKKQMVVVGGLAHRAADASEDGANGDHARGTSTWLTGVHPKHTEGADVYNGISADQIAAPVIGKDTPLPSLEMSIDLNYLVGNCGNGYSCVYMNTLAWRSATTALPTENNPRAIFERLFGDGGTTAQRIGLARENRSILDSVTAEMARLKRRLGANDLTKVDDYVDSVREIERRIQAVEAQAQTTLPDLERPVGIPAGVPGRHHARDDFHARSRAEFPLLSGDRHHRRASRPVASWRQPESDGALRQGEHVSGAALCIVPAVAAIDARW
jgi:hypothetical protein